MRIKKRRANSIRNMTISLLLPKPIKGIGPIKITPPYSTFPLLTIPMIDETMIRRIPMNISKKPTKIKLLVKFIIRNLV